MNTKVISILLVQCILLSCVSNSPHNYSWKDIEKEFSTINSDIYENSHADINMVLSILEKSKYKYNVSTSFEFYTNPKIIIEEHLKKWIENEITSNHSNTIQIKKEENYEKSKELVTNLFNQLDHSRKSMLFASPEYMDFFIDESFSDKRWFYQELLEQLDDDENKRLQEIKRLEQRDISEQKLKNDIVKWQNIFLGEFILISPNRNEKYLMKGELYDDTTIILYELLPDSSFTKWGIVEFDILWNWNLMKVKAQVMDWGSYRFIHDEGITDKLKSNLIMYDIQYSGDTYFLVSDENIRRYENGGSRNWTLEDAGELYLINKLME